jgi:hypothetical protein
MTVEINTICFRTFSNFEYNEYVKFLKSKYGIEVKDLARYVEEIDSKILAHHSDDYAICQQGGKINAR